MSGFPSAIALVAAALASVIEPPLLMTPSEWARLNLIVPDGPRAGEKIDLAMTPYLIEPMDAAGPDEATNKIVVRKSAQTGFTTMGIAIVGHTIDCDPCRMGVVQPTDSALTEFLAEKLNPAIEQTRSLAKKVKAQASRSGAGSTAYRKKFPGGSLSCMIATSTADLRSKTLKKILKDEASEYPDDLDGQGSPHGMLEARYESFLATADWKEINISTPVLKGACYIDEEFEAGDQRYWHVPCPHCAGEFVFKPEKDSFRYNDAYPYAAYFVAPCCGSIIHGHEKNGLVRQGRWIATAPAPGKHRSYHFDALSSPFVPWDKIAERAIKAGDDPAKLKTFYNLTLGLAYEMRTDTPDHTRLMERREDFKRGHIPPRGLLLVGSADVQMRGIYYEITAFAPNRESWTVDAGYIDGDTADAERGAFAGLTDVYERDYPDAYGNRRRVDLFGVDSGYRSNVVYTWTRRRAGALALKGDEGWSKPALAMPAPVDISVDGRKIRKGATVYKVGTWSLKAGFYSDLRKEGAKAGAEQDPPGYCHFGQWLDEVYFKQITAEYLADEKVRGRNRKVWKVKFGGENHWLDCRIYNLALAYHLGLASLAPHEWAALARMRGMPVGDEGDMFAPAPVKAVVEAASVPAPVPQPAETPAAQPAESGWLGERKSKNWFSR